MADKEKNMQGNAEFFANEMKKLINNKDMSDIRFVIGATRKTVYAHRCILSARCEVFRAMFAEQGTKGKDCSDVPFVLSDMMPEVFMPMLEYIYTNSVKLTAKNCVDVLGSATEYGLDGLRQVCVEYLLDKLSINTACEAMQAGVTFGQDHLRDAALDYIAEHTEKVFQTKGFHELSDTALAHILKSSDLHIDEMDIVVAVREWATVNSVVLGKSVTAVSKRVIGQVRLPLLSPEELNQVEEDNQKDKLIAVEQLAHAWKCHALHKPDKHNQLTVKRQGTKPRESHRGIEALW